VDGDPGPENGYVQREEGESRFMRVDPEAQKRLQKLDLYLLRGSESILPERFQVVFGSDLCQGVTPASAYCNHLVHLHKQRLKDNGAGYPNEAQVGLLFGKGSDHGWTSDTIKRLILEGWGFESLEAIPSREVFDEILFQLQDEDLAQVFAQSEDEDWAEDTTQPGGSTGGDSTAGGPKNGGPPEGGQSAPQNGGGPDEGNGTGEAPNAPGGGQERPQGGGEQAEQGAQAFGPGLEPPEDVKDTGAPDGVFENVPGAVEDRMRERGLGKLVPLQRAIRDGSILQVKGVGDSRAQEMADFLGVELGVDTREGVGDPGESNPPTEEFPPPEEDPDVPDALK
jgi:hypothetical protein